MEQLTTYRVKGKDIGLVFLFKYDLKGNYKGNLLEEGILTDEQKNWLFRGYIPKGAVFSNAKELISLMKVRFPASEKIMIEEWEKNKDILEKFDIKKSPADLSFDALWNLYGYKESRKDAEKLFNKLKEEQIIKCFIQVPKYKKKLAQSTTAQALLSTWISKERFNDEYPEAVNTKNFNPMIAELANKKTNRRV